MRALIVSIISLSLVVGIWIVYYNYSDAALDKMKTSCEDTVIPAIKDDDWETARTEFKKQYKDWHKYRRAALFFLDTENVNSTDASFARALEYIDEEDASNARGEVLSLKEQLNSLKANEKPGLSNIF